MKAAGVEREMEGLEPDQWSSLPVENRAKTTSQMSEGLLVGVLAAQEEGLG